MRVSTISVCAFTASSQDQSFDVLETINSGRFLLAGILPSSLHLLYIRQFPRLVEEGLVRAVEPKKGKPAATRHGLNPIRLFIFGWRLRTDVDVHRAIRVPLHLLVV